MLNLDLRCSVVLVPKIPFSMNVFEFLFIVLFAIMKTEFLRSSSLNGDEIMDELWRFGQKHIAHNRTDLGRNGTIIFRSFHRSIYSSFYLKWNYRLTSHSDNLLCVIPTSPFLLKRSCPSERNWHVIERKTNKNECNYECILISMFNNVRRICYLKAIWL